MAITTTIIDDVADAITRLRYLEQKSRGDDEMMVLLVRQKDALAQEIAEIKHDHSIELFKACAERDAAIKRADEVRALITKLGETAATGLKRIRESDTDEVQHPKTPLPHIVKQADDIPPTQSEAAAAHKAKMPISAVDERIGGYSPRAG